MSPMADEAPTGRALPSADGVHREADERDEKTPVAQSDDEAVPPSQRFEELPLLDYCSGH